MDFFMSSPTVHAMMMQGTAMYAKITDAKELSTKLRGVFNFPLGYYHIMVYADSGITRLQDVKGKRASTGPPGGGATGNLAQLREIVTGYQAGHAYAKVTQCWDTRS